MQFYSLFLTLISSIFLFYIQTMKSWQKYIQNVNVHLRKCCLLLCLEWSAAMLLFNVEFFFKYNYYMQSFTGIWLDDKRPISWTAGFKGEMLQKLKKGADMWCPLKWTQGLNGLRWLALCDLSKRKSWGLVITLPCINNVTAWIGQSSNYNPNAFDMLSKCDCYYDSVVYYQFCCTK